MTDFLSDKVHELEQRLEDLRPLHEEYLRLERAKAALDGLEAPSPPPRGRPRRSAPSGNGRRRRRREGGTRAEQTLEAVRQNPGMTVAELAEHLGIEQPNYLYRVLNDLRSQGAVDKQGRGFVAT